jgi:hypothetical protein
MQTIKPLKLILVRKKIFKYEKNIPSRSLYVAYRKHGECANEGFDKISERQAEI